MPNPNLTKAEIERRRKAVEFREKNEARFKRGGRLKMLLARRQRWRRSSRSLSASLPTCSARATPLGSAARSSPGSPAWR